MALKTMIEKVEASRALFNEACETARADIAQGIAEVLPEGFDLVWWQHTPYFNDGDPCVFRVSEPQLVASDDATPGTPWESDGEHDVVDAEALCAVWDRIPESILKRTFDNDVSIRINRAGEVLVGNYTSHD